MTVAGGKAQVKRLFPFTRMSGVPWELVLTFSWVGAGAVSGSDNGSKSGMSYSWEVSVSQKGDSDGTREGVDERDTTC